MLGSVDVHMLCRLVLQKANLLAVCPDLFNSPSGRLHQQEYALTSTDATTSYFTTTSSLFALHQKLPACPTHDHERKQHIEHSNPVSNIDAIRQEPSSNMHRSISRHEIDDDLISPTQEPTASNQEEHKTCVWTH